MMRTTLAATLAILIVAPSVARADERTQDERLAALVAQLKDPIGGFRAAYKLADAGPAAIPDLLNGLGSSPLADERIEGCLREIARTKEGAKAAIERLSQAARPVSRARLARALAQAGAVEAIYPIVDALDSPQEPLEVATFGPQGTRARETSRVLRPVSTAAATFGERAATAIRKRLEKTTSSLFITEGARTLGLIKSTESVPQLIAIASSDDRTPTERATALAALVAIGTPAARDAFSRGLAADDATVRRVALRGLSLAPDPSAVPQVARMLEEEKDDDLRLDEIKALAAAEDLLAAAPLRAALLAAPRAGDSLRGQIAQAAAEGLARTGDRGAPATLVKALEVGMGFQVDRAISGALGRIPDLGVNSRERLRVIAGTSEAPSDGEPQNAKPQTVEPKRFGETTRACAAWILALRGEEDALKALLASARSSEWAVRAAVAALLGEGKLDGAVPVLVLLAKDKEAYVRRAAATALGKSDDSTAGAALLASSALAVDKDPVVRRVYALAFQDALPQGTLERDQRKQGALVLGRALETEFQDATLDERRAQATTLARLGERPALLRVAGGALLASEPPAESRRAAIEALVMLGKNDATEEALLAVLKDPVVGDDAALALVKIRGESFFEPRWRALLAPVVPFH